MLYHSQERQVLDLNIIPEDERKRFEHFLTLEGSSQHKI
jgi:hypothetical protein